MKKLILSACCALPVAALAAPCLPVPELIALDAAFLQGLLADDYVWVHTLASAYDTKAAVLARTRLAPAGYKSRTTSDVQAHALGDSVVLRGLSTVEQWNPDGKTFRSNRYQFMRTYVNAGGACKLLAVQTMKVWSSESK
jgi:ketosteroid isomerase-like protein